MPESESSVWNIPENYLLEVFNWLAVPGNTEALQAAGEDGALFVYNVLSQNGFINPDELPFEYFSENIYPAISSQGVAGLQSILNAEGAINVSGSTGIAAPDLSGATAAQLQENDEGGSDEEEPLTREDIGDFLRELLAPNAFSGGVGTTPLTGGVSGGGGGGYYGGPGFQAPMIGGNIGNTPYVASNRPAGPEFSSPAFEPDIAGGEVSPVNDPNGYLTWLLSWIDEHFPSPNNDESGTPGNSAPHQAFYDAANANPDADWEAALQHDAAVRKHGEEAVGNFYSSLAPTTEQAVSIATDQASQQLEEFTPDIGELAPPGAPPAAGANTQGSLPGATLNQPPTAMPATPMPQGQDPKKGTPSPQAMGQAARQVLPQQQPLGTVMSGGLGQPAVQSAGSPTGRGVFSSQ